MTLKFTVLTILLSIVLSANSISIYSHNDVYFDTDEHYTNGTGVTWVSGPNRHGEDFSGDYYAFTKSILKLLPFHKIDESKRFDSSLLLQQRVFTPKDKENPVNDVPFAGTLELEIGLHEWDLNDFHSYRLKFGVMGPSSGAQFAQDGFHDLIDTKKIEGWNEQIQDQAIFALGYDYGEKSYERSFEQNFQMDWFNNFSIELGNFSTSASIGSMARFGQNLPNGFCVASDKIGAAPNESFGLASPNETIGWSIGFGVSLKGAHNNLLFEEANKIGEFETSPISAQILFNPALYFKDFQASFSLQSVNYEKNGSLSRINWGGYAFIWNY